MSLMPRYSNKFSCEFVQDKHSMTNPLYYWNDLSKCIFRPGIFTYDKDGVFIFDTKGIIYYHPAAIPQAILSFIFEQTANPKIDRTKEIRAQLKWILNNYDTIEGNGIVWFYKFDYGTAKAPWSSGISQGLIISALVRASILFKDNQYLDLAKLAFVQMNNPLEKGGHRFSDKQYPLFYEEGHDNHHILNGHLFSLLGVYDLYTSTNDEMYKTAFDIGVETIKLNIHEFNIGFFSKYAGVGMETCNNSYHQVHIQLFKAFYIITKDVFFKEQADDMLYQYNSTWCKIQHLCYLIKINIIYKLKGRKN